jgi:two-component system response regulator FixJ
MNNQAVVHVIDDDSGVRNSLRLLLESASLPVRIYESGEAFLASLDPMQPGCIVLDLRMPGLSGIEVLQKLRDHHEIPAIVIAGHADVADAIRSMKLGAIDLLEKPLEPQVLLQAVKAAIRDSIELQRLRAQREDILRRLAKLTARERELLKLIVAGRSNKQIASDLKISMKTVENHRSNLMAKMQAANAADLARLSTVAGIVPNNEFS